jgi:hypothetical protein
MTKKNPSIFLPRIGAGLSQIKFSAEGSFRVGEWGMVWSQAQPYLQALLLLDTPQHSPT